MRVLNKSQPHTWLANPGSRLKPLDRDHVVAASYLTFTEFQGAQVDVRGWMQSDDRHDWAHRNDTLRARAGQTHTGVGVVRQARRIRSVSCGTGVQFTEGDTAG